MGYDPTGCDVIELALGTLTMPGQTVATSREQHADSPPAERILSWGRYPKVAHHHVHKPAWNDQLPEVLEAAEAGSLLPYASAAVTATLVSTLAAT